MKDHSKTIVRKLNVLTSTSFLILKLMSLTSTEMVECENVNIAYRQYFVSDFEKLLDTLK